MNNQLKTVLLLGAMSALLVGMGGALGPNYLMGFGVVALLMNFVSYFFSDSIVLKMSGAREVPAGAMPGLRRTVEELSRRANIPVPRLYVMDDPQPNAFATGRNPEKGAVAVTTGILDLLTERELRGVIAHELAHIKNRDILVSTIAAMLATAITYAAHAAAFAGRFAGSSRDDERDGPGPLATLALAIVAPLAATLIQLGVSRSREYLADQTGAAICGDPDALASALEKLKYGASRVHSRSAEPATASLYIVNPLAAGQSFAKLFSTHPAIEDRVQRLRSMRAAA